jgi:hypothetical protein
VPRRLGERVKSTRSACSRSVPVWKECARSETTPETNGWAVGSYRYSTQ